MQTNSEGGHMELRDYGLVLSRYWRTWVGIALAGLLIALAVVVATPATYQAKAQVFVASTGEGTSGSQFVNQRVMSYPDVAESRAVLGPVIEELGLRESFATLRSRVSASNPADTSQIDIAVSGADAAEAAEVANAVAERFGSVVEELERPGGGESPVDLTMTDPATVPSSPAAPVPALLLTLGLVVGLALGAAAAIVRSRLDTRLHTEDDVRAALAATGQSVAVHAAPRRRVGRRSAAGRPASLVARQLEPLAEERAVRVVVVSPTPDDRRTAQAFVDDVAVELRRWDVPATVVEGTSGETNGSQRAGVQLAVGTPLASLREWRRIAREHDAVVLVVEPGRVDRAELCEILSVFTAAGVRLLAVVLPGRSPRGRAGSGPSVRVPAQSVGLQKPVGKPPVPVGRG
jgi:capsular polysaccharide biosynthesis protein